VNAKTFIRENADLAAELRQAVLTKRGLVAGGAAAPSAGTAAVGDDTEVDDD
jgi:hypothetical protein